MGTTIDNTAPSCTVCGNNPCMSNGKAINGKKQWKIRCQVCHKIYFAGKRGLTPTQWTNSFHPYLKHRKQHCENIGPIFWLELIDYVYNKTGRVVEFSNEMTFACTSTIFWEGSLQVDHKDGNPENHDPDNLHTLCANCHAFKSWKFGDAHTDGRKKLKEQRENDSFEKVFYTQLAA